MAVGGLTGFFLDNVLPGTLEERGIRKWRAKYENEEDTSGKKLVADPSTYDIPFITDWLQKFKWVKYVPFLPYYGPSEKPETNGVYKHNSQRERNDIAEENV